MDEKGLDKILREEKAYRHFIRGLSLPVEVTNPLLRASEAREGYAGFDWQHTLRLEKEEK